MNNIAKIITYHLFCKFAFASLMMPIHEITSLHAVDPTNHQEHHEWINLENLVEQQQTVIIPKEIANINTHEAIYLGAILYFSTDKWTTWINDQPFTNESPENNLFKIAKISSQCAEIELKKYKNLAPIKLKANQTITNVENAYIVDGDARKKDTQTVSYHKEQL